MMMFMDDKTLTCIELKSGIIRDKTPDDKLVCTQTFEKKFTHPIDQCYWWKSEDNASFKKQ